MARLPRFVLPGQPQHLIQRGNNRQDIFRTVSDYQFYIEKLLDASDKHQCDIHAYVLMTNHVHLLITPHAENSLGKMMQMIGRYYVQYFNRAYKRTGTLWEGRYKATLINTEQYLFTCMRYIELNPVRVKSMAQHPSDYPWSSYSCNATGLPDLLVTPHDLYQGLGHTAEERQTAYRKLFCDRIPEITLENIREATNKAWALGNEEFKVNMKQKLGRAMASCGQGGDHKSAAYRKTRNQRV